MTATDTWNSQLFSTSVNNVLQKVEQGCDFFTIVMAMHEEHPEYGHSDVSTYLRTKSEGRGIKFQEFVQFLQDNKEYLKQGRLTAGEWVSKVLSIVNPLPAGQVINGRLFLFALILSEYQFTFNSDVAEAGGEKIGSYNSAPNFKP
jgi:hypothetical protein